MLGRIVLALDAYGSAENVADDGTIALGLAVTFAAAAPHMV